MNICVLSNSHVAALKLSYDGFPELLKNKNQVTFFASRGSRLNALHANNNCLVSCDESVANDISFTSGGRSRIDIGEFDGFLVHALGFGYPYVFYSKRCYSRQFLIEALPELWQAQTFFHLCLELRKITDKPIFLSPQPFVSEADSKIAAQLSKSLMPILDMVFFKQCFANYIGDSVCFLMQPEDTIVSNFFTAEKYSVDAARFDIGDLAEDNTKHPPEDHFHMNTMYGDCVWRDFFRQQR